MTVENKMVIEQSCTTQKTNADYLTKKEIYKKESKWWVEPIPSSPYLPMVPFPSILESPILFNGKEEQIDEMIELIETSQRS